jgi:hypothetical protein
LPENPEKSKIRIHPVPEQSGFSDFYRVLKIWYKSATTTVKRYDVLVEWADQEENRLL